MVITKSLNLYWLTQACQGKIVGNIIKLLDTPIFFCGVSWNLRCCILFFENCAFWGYSLWEKAPVREGFAEKKIRKSIEKRWIVWKMTCFSANRTYETYSSVESDVLNSLSVSLVSIYKTFLVRPSMNAGIYLPAGQFIFSANSLGFWDNGVHHIL